MIARDKDWQKKTSEEQENFLEPLAGALFDEANLGVQLLFCGWPKP